MLGSIAASPVPDGLKSGTIETTDGFKLRYGVSNDGRALRGTVCLFQGRRGAIELDYETINDLRARGFAVALFDWRGQGLSQHLTKNRSKGHIRDFRQYETDVESFMRKVVLPDCPPPYYGLAHSLGANVLLRSLQKNTWFEACVMVAPLLGFADRRLSNVFVSSAFKLLAATGFGKLSVWGNFKKREFAGNLLTHDPNRYAIYKQMVETHPDIDLGAPTVGWMAAALQSNAYLGSLKGQGRFHAPVLMVAAGDDKVVSLDKIRRFCARVCDIPLVIVDNAYHELLMEKDSLREQFWAAFDSFMDRHAVAGEGFENERKT